jgi:heptosyltransferase-2
MKILIILPNWLGDAIMTTPAIELLSKYYPQAKFTFLGSYVSIEALKHHPKCERAIVDETKKASSRLVATYKLAKELGIFSMVVNFRSQLHASLLAYFTGTVLTLSRTSWHATTLLSHPKKVSSQQHLVLQYIEIAMQNTDTYQGETPQLQLYIPQYYYDKPTLGINAGATYGSAKRWYPERFAAVASNFTQKYDIVIFGGPNEVEMAGEIEENLQKLNVTNYTNLAGKTSVEELCSHIGGCSLFITNDSGPMHIAAAYQVPTVAIFGPTKHTETSQWMNEKSVIVRHEMECSPCMKRECPLKHHECMTTITALEVIEAVKKLL